MGIPKPSEALLKVVMTEKGRLEFQHKGETLPGVMAISCSHDRGERATVTVTFIGLADRLETEGAV